MTTETGLRIPPTRDPPPNGFAVESDSVKFHSLRPTLATAGGRETPDVKPEPGERVHPARRREQAGKPTVAPT